MLILSVLSGVLYKKYCLHYQQAEAHDAFYLTPISKPRSVVWYTNQHIGVHSLANTVKRLCEKGRICGCKSNNSLRVTTATRIYQSGAEKQLIMECMEQNLTDGIRGYKHS